MTRNQMRDLALQFGFKLKRQDNGEEDLNPYVYDLMEALLRMKYTDSNQLRIKQLEKERDELNAQLNASLDALNWCDYASRNDGLTPKIVKIVRDTLNSTRAHNLAEHDAEVIEKARSHVNREIGSQQLAEDYDMELCWYINQLRQKAQEADHGNNR